MGKLIAFLVEAVQLVGSGLSSLLLLRPCLVSAAVRLSVTIPETAISLKRPFSDNLGASGCLWPHLA